MQIENNTFLCEINNWTYRLRESANKSSDRVLLLLHGWSGDENSMWVFAKDIPKDYWVISLRAPYSAGEMGYSWRNGIKDRSWELPKISDFHPTLENLAIFLAEWAINNSVNLKTIDLIGFSQGAALICASLLSSSLNIDKAACLAGFMPGEGINIARPGLLTGKRIFVSHGIGDEIIPLNLGQEMVNILKFAGAEVDLCEEEVGHKVGIQCYKGLKKFFRQ